MNSHVHHLIIIIIIIIPHIFNFGNITISVDLKQLIMQFLPCLFIKNSCNLLKIMVKCHLKAY